MTTLQDIIREGEYSRNIANSGKDGISSFLAGMGEIGKTTVGVTDKLREIKNQKLENEYKMEQLNQLRRENQSLSQKLGISPTEDQDKFSAETGLPQSYGNLNLEEISKASTARSQQALAGYRGAQKEHLSKPKFNKNETLLNITPAMELSTGGKLKVGETRTLADIQRLEGLHKTEKQSALRSQYLDIINKKMSYMNDSRFIESFNRDPSVRKSQQSVDAAATIRDLALSNNPIAAAAIPTFSARMSGEVGNLSEADKRPFGGSRAILSRLDAALSEMATGTLTAENKDFILDLTNLVEERALQNMDKLADSRSSQFRNAGLGQKEKLNKMLRPGTATPSPKKQGGVIHQDASGNKAIVYPDGTFEEVR